MTFPGNTAKRRLPGSVGCLAPSPRGVIPAARSSLTLAPESRLSRFREQILKLKSQKPPKQNSFSPSCDLAVKTESDELPKVLTGWFRIIPHLTWI